MFRKLKYIIGDFLQAQGVKIIQKRIVKGWCVVDYFNDIFIPSIKNFCKLTLKEEYIHNNCNSGKKAVLETTLKLIDEANWTYNLLSGAGEIKRRKAREYIIKNIDYYWS